MKKSLISLLACAALAAAAFCLPASASPSAPPPGQVAVTSHPGVAAVDVGVQSAAATKECDMKMRCVGKGVYHAGAGGIEKPGDFGWRIDGALLDRPEIVQIALFCPRTGVCLQKVHQAPAGDTPHGRFWSWNGNWEAPTIKPSIACEVPRRCGSHMSIADGVITGDIRTAWTRPPRT